LIYGSEIRFRTERNGYDSLRTRPSSVERAGMAPEIASAADPDPINQKANVRKKRD
jgi:hypothetical protein